MRYSLFQSPTDKLPLNVIIHILSFLSSEHRKALALADTEWSAIITDIERPIPVLPSLDRIALFKDIRPEEISIKIATGGMTNLTVFVSVGSQKYVLRVPGKDTGLFIKRKKEQKHAGDASDKGLNARIRYSHVDGTQLTDYIEESTPLTPELLKSPVYLQLVATLFKQLHSDTKPKKRPNIFQRNVDLLAIIRQKDETLLPDDVDRISTAIKAFHDVYSRFMITACRCHGDPTPSNFLMSKGKLYLLDWEYAGWGDKLLELVYFCHEAQLDDALTQVFLSYYFPEVTQSIQDWFILYQPVATWWIALWSWAQLANQSTSATPEAYRALAEKSLAQTTNYLASSNYQYALVRLQKGLESQPADLVARAF